MIIIHAKDYVHALGYAKGRNLPYIQWMYATADNIRGLRKFEMIVLPGADSHEEHAEIMRRAAEQEFEVNKSAS